MGEEKRDTVLAEGGKRVLISISVPASALGVRNLLESAGLKIGGMAISHGCVRTFFKNEPHLLVADVPAGFTDFWSWTEDWREHDACPAVVAYADGWDATALRQGMLRNVKGFVSTHDSLEVLLDTVFRVLEGETAVSPFLQGMLESKDEIQVAASPEIHLGIREEEIMTLIGKGMRRGEIARQLGLSPRTIDTYFVRLKARLGVPSTTDLVKIALKKFRDSSER